MKMIQAAVLVVAAAAVSAIPAAAADLPDSPCFKCHYVQKKVFAEGTVHNPVSESDCGSCHADHGPTNKLVLTEEIPQLCFGCHDEIKGSHVHDPVGSGECLECHKVHNSERKKLLAKASPDLCYGCHDDFNSKPTVHSPVAEGDCGACHDGHKAEYASLLKKSYSRERYTEYSEKAYELCFECHEVKTFQQASTQDATEFRNGTANLHYVHVVDRLEGTKYRIEKKQKRMTCNGCHFVHGSDQPRLIRPSLSRGEMTLYTISFKKSENGGTCVVGCHKTREYSRLNPVTEVSSADGPKSSSEAQKGAN
jgi:predicted CXXCH cytochrome family protein